MSNFKRVVNVLFDLTGFPVFQIMRDQNVALILNGSVSNAIEEMDGEKGHRCRQYVRRLMLTSKYSRLFAKPGSKRAYDANGADVGTASKMQRERARHRREFRKDQNTKANQWSRPLSNTDDQ